MPIETVYQNQHCKWINVEAPTLQDLKFLEETYHIYGLLLEDTMDPNHLPKFEEDGGTRFFLLRENTKLERRALNTLSDVSTKLGIFLQDDVIITVHRMKNLSVVEYLNEIKAADGLSPTPDGIALALALKVMKSFDDESQKLLEVMDKIENDIFLKNNGNSKLIRQLYNLKRRSSLNSRILHISGSIIDQFKILSINDSEFINLKDKHDDVVTDFEHLTSQSTNLISMFLAMSDQRANQVMKVLAIYSMYFFPITFIAGIYGMNFDNMPELHEPFGYFMTLGLMVLIVVITFVYVRRKRW